MLERSDARELHLEAGPLSVRVRRPARTTFGPVVLIDPIASYPAYQDTTALHHVLAPLTGIWYDAPSPGAAPYVQPGSHVEKGTAIGLIETMKIFNEIASDATGRVLQVHVRRGDLVAVRSPLISVDTADTVTLGPDRS